MILSNSLTESISHRLRKGSSLTVDRI